VRRFLFYFSIGVWNSSDSVVFLFYFSIGVWNSSDSVVFVFYFSIGQHTVGTVPNSDRKIKQKTTHCRNCSKLRKKNKTKNDALSELFQTPTEK
jgi:hypothetical protein